MTRAILPAIGRVIELDCRAMVQLDTARTALAIERYRIINGNLPEKLNNLVPAFLDSIPIDPYDGKPLKYKRLASGFVVYSVGPDE